jgi:excisionase family DNA binding protein
MTAPARTQPRFLTIDEVAELLRTTPATLRWWRHQRSGPPAFRSGRRLLYDRADVEAYIAQLRDAAAENRSAA